MAHFNGRLINGTRVHMINESHHRPPGFYVSRCGGVIVSMNHHARLVGGGDVDCQRCLNLMEGSV